MPKRTHEELFEQLFRETRETRERQLGIEKILFDTELWKGTIMAAIDDLNKAVANLTAAETALEGRVDALGAANDPAIATAATAIQAAADKLNGLAVPPEPAPAA